MASKVHKQPLMQLGSQWLNLLKHLVIKPCIRNKYYIFVSAKASICDISDARPWPNWPAHSSQLVTLDPAAVHGARYKHWLKPNSQFLSHCSPISRDSGHLGAVLISSMPPSSKQASNLMTLNVKPLCFEV